MSTKTTGPSPPPPPSSKPKPPPPPPTTPGTSKTSSSIVHTSSSKETTTSSEDHTSSTHTPSPTKPSTTLLTKTLSHSSSDTTGTTSTTSTSPEHDPTTTTQSSPTSTGNTVQSTSTTPTLTSTYPTTQSGLPTTQSLSVSGTGDFTFTSLYTSTDSNGISHTVTQIIAQPSKAPKPGGFVHNSGAVAGVSILVGIAGAAMIAFVILYARKRRKAREDDFAAFSEMSYVAGGVSSYYGTAGGNQQNNEYGMQPMEHNRSTSAGSLNQPPLAPVDTLRDVHNHPHTTPSLRNPLSADGHDRLAGERPEYNPYVQNVESQTPNYGAYGSAVSLGPSVGAGAEPEGAMYDDDPFASHSQDGHSQVSVSKYYGDTGAAPPPRRSVSTKSRGNMTFEDEEYYGDHGPTNDDNSVVLGRPSTSQLDSRLSEEAFRSQRGAYGRVVDGAPASGATPQDHYDYSRRYV